MVLVLQPRKIKPKWPMLDRQHPLADGLVLAIPFVADGNITSSATVDPWLRDMQRSIRSKDTSLDAPTFKTNMTATFPASTTDAWGWGELGRCFQLKEATTDIGVDGALHLDVATGSTQQVSILAVIAKTDAAQTGVRTITALRNVHYPGITRFNNDILATRYSGTWLTGSGSLTDTRPHIILAVFVAGRYELWVDGVLADSSTDATGFDVVSDVSHDRWRMGNRDGAGTQQHDMDIYDWRVWNRALSTQECKEVSSPAHVWDLYRGNEPIIYRPFQAGPPPLPVPSPVNQPNRLLRNNWQSYLRGLSRKRDIAHMDS